MIPVGARMVGCVAHKPGAPKKKHPVSRMRYTSSYIALASVRLPIIRDFSHP